MVTVSANDSNSDYTPAPVGNHLSVCIQVIDLGTHHSQMYDNWSRKVRISWELVNETHTVKKDDKEVVENWIVSRDYTLSLGERSNLRKDLISWRGRDFTDEELALFDLANILGKPAMVNVAHGTSQKGRTYSKVTAVANVPKGVDIPNHQFPLVNWDLDFEKFDQETFDEFPEFIQDRIKESREWQRHKEDVDAAGADPASEDEDIPF